jgi:hypothetical protein
LAAVWPICLASDFIPSPRAIVDPEEPSVEFDEVGIEPEEPMVEPDKSPEFDEKPASLAPAAVGVVCMVCSFS